MVEVGRSASGMDGGWRDIGVGMSTHSGGAAGGNSDGDFRLLGDVRGR